MAEAVNMLSSCVLTVQPATPEFIRHLCTVLLEGKLGRDLISLTRRHCRHHIIELMMAKVTDTVTAASSAPTSSCSRDFANIGAQLTSLAMEVD